MCSLHQVPLRRPTDERTDRKLLECDATTLLSDVLIFSDDLGTMTESPPNVFTCAFAAASRFLLSSNVENMLLPYSVQSLNSHFQNLQDHSKHLISGRWK